MFLLKVEKCLVIYMRINKNTTRQLFDTLGANTSSWKNKQYVYLLHLGSPAFS